MAYRYIVNAVSYIGDTHQQSDNCFFVDGLTSIADGVCNGADIETKCKGKKHLFSVFSGSSGIEHVCNRLEDTLMKKNSQKIRSKVQFELRNIMNEISGTICKNENDSTLSAVCIEGNNVYAAGFGDINIYKFGKKNGDCYKIDFPLYSPLTAETNSDISVKLRQPARSKCVGKLSARDEFLLADSNLVSTLGDEQIVSVLKEYGKNAPAKLIDLASYDTSQNLTVVHINVKRSVSPLFFIVPLIFVALMAAYFAFPGMVTTLKNLIPSYTVKTETIEKLSERDAAPSSAQEKIADTKSSAEPPTVDLIPLSVQLDDIASTITGVNSKVAYCIKDITTGAFIEKNNSFMSSASVIKLYIMAEIYRQAECGELIIDDRIDSLLSAMITVSDNNASNELARIAGGGDINLGFRKITDNAKSLGCTDTQFVNAINVPSSGPALKSNSTSVCDCALLLEKIYSGTLVSEEYSNKMLELLKQQTRRGKIPKYIPDDVVVANKTGETSIAQNDVAIVFAKDKPYIICIMISKFENTEYETTEVISKMSEATYNFFTQAKH